MFYSNQQTQEKPAIALLRKMLSSGLFLALAILYSVMVLCSVVSAVTPTTVKDLTAEAEDVLYEMEMELGEDMSEAIAALEGLETYEDTFQTLQLVGIVVSLIGLIPSILVLVGLWKLYTTAKSSTGEAMSPSGLSLIKISVIIELVAACIFCGLLLILCFVLLIGAQPLGELLFPYYAESAATFAAVVMIVAVIFLLVIAAVLALLIVYALKVLKTLKVVKNTMITGEPNEKVSIFIIVILFIGALSVFSGLGTIWFDPLAGLSVLSSGAFACVAAIGMCMYRSKMKQLQYVPQMYQQPTYQAQTQQMPYQQPLYQQPQQPYTVTYTTCENCGQQYPAGSDVCPKCGTLNENRK